jgi:hypothetical protein
LSANVDPLIMSSLGRTAPVTGLNSHHARSSFAAGPTGKAEPSEDGTATVRLFQAPQAKESRIASTDRAKPTRTTTDAAASAGSAHLFLIRGSISRCVPLVPKTEL